MQVVAISRGKAKRCWVRRVRSSHEDPLGGNGVQESRQALGAPDRVRGVQTVKVL